MKKIVAAALGVFSIVTAFAQDVSGAGATFPAPIYAKWADTYNKETNIRINYQSIGSGAGIKQIEASTVVFGATDMPLTDERLAASGLFQFPTVIGGVVPVVNIPGMKAGTLKLTGKVLGDIYLGKISNWKDPAIAALNPGLSLPNALIMPIRRSDGSGTTFLFTNYLSKVNDEWKTKVGEGTAVNWPSGAGGKGNEGVSAYVTRLQNSIGYVEYAYAKQSKMTYVIMQNAAGNWVAPNDEAFKAAASGANWDKSYYQVLTNQADKNAWPITGATFILIHMKTKNAGATRTVLEFFDWAYTKGDASAADLDYVPLPMTLKTKIRNDWQKLGLK